MAIALVAYDPTVLENTSGDTISNRYWPLAVMKHGEFRLNFAASDIHDVGFAAIFYENGDMLPRADIGIAVFTFPFYFIADLINLGGSDWDAERINRVSRWNAIFLAVLALLLLYSLSLKFVPAEAAFASSILFALGTYHWSLGAQGLSTQTATVLLYMVAMHIMWKVTNAKPQASVKGLAALLGVLCALGWATRPPALVLLVPCFVSLIGRRSMLHFLGGFAGIIVPVILYNLHFYHGYWFGWRGVMATLTSGSTQQFLLAGNLPYGLAGILFSPNRGAIVFLPILLLTPWLWRRFMPSTQIRKGLRDIWAFRVPMATGHKVNGIPPAFSRAMAAGAIAYLVGVARMDIWHGSWAYGPRYLYDIQPFIWPAVTIAIAKIIEDFRSKKARAAPRWITVLVIVFGLQGIAIHALGHFNYDLYVWNYKKGEIDNADAWEFGDWILKDVWEAGPNRNRRPDALKRLKGFGY